MSVSLGRLVDINPATPEFDRVPANENITFLPLEACWPDGRADLSRRATRGSVAVGYTRFRRGDVLMPKVTPTFEAGRVSVVHSQTPVGAGTTELHVLRAHPGVEPRYIAYVCRSQRLLQEGHAALEGVGNLRRVPIDFLRLFPVAVTDGAEQRAIADYLDRETAQIDALIGKQERLIETLRERRDGTWARAYTSFGGDAPEVPLRRLIESVTDGPFGSSLTSAHYVDTGVRVIRLGNIGINQFRNDDAAFITSEYARELSDFAVKSGDVVVAGLGDDRMPLGRAAEVPDIGPAIVKADCFRVRPRRGISSAYLAWAMSAPQVRQQIRLLARGSTRSRLNTSVVREVRLRVPSVAAQADVLRQSASSLAKIDTLIAKAEQFIALARQRRSALITAAVTGQIDVRTAA